MFGELIFLLCGKMCCGIVGDRLMVRVGPDAYDDALEEPLVAAMDFKSATQGDGVRRRGRASSGRSFPWVG